jgi:hypothetical protein
MARVKCTGFSAPSISCGHLERALTLNPNDVRIVCQMGELATFLGRPEEGEHWVRRAMRLNPYSMPRSWLTVTVKEPPDEAMDGSQLTLI